MKKPFNNQLATQRLRSEDSVTGGNAPANTAATFKAGDGMQYATKKAFKKKNEVKDVEPKYAAGKANNYVAKKWGWKPAPSIPNRPSKGGFQYKQMFEDMEEGVLQPVNLDKDSLSPMEYQQAQKYESFNENDWTFDDVSKRYIKKQAEPDQEMQTEDEDKKYFVKVSVRDAKRALDVLRDNPSYRGVELNGSDTYYTADEDLAYDMMMDFGTQDIEVIGDNFSDSHLYGSEDLNEALTYNKFKREAATRPNKDALHEALKSINKKLHEINRLMEYSTNMKMELEEDYSPRTGKVVNKLEKQLAEIYKKVKSLK
jgi:hypothetical protein